jgi:hypothetical protein
MTVAVLIRSATRAGLVSASGVKRVGSVWVIETNEHGTALPLQGRFFLVWGNRRERDAGLRSVSCRRRCPPRANR